MKFIKTYDNFKPIKINNEKPFKVKKNIDTSIKYLEKGIKSLRARMDNPKKKRDINGHAKMNDDKNKKIQKLKDLQFKKIKQTTYLKANPVQESSSNDLLTILTNPKFKEGDLIPVMGFDEDEYEIKTNVRSWYDKNNSDEGLEFCTNFSTIEELHDLDDSAISYVLQLSNYYNNQDYYVDDDEMNYLCNYLSKKTLIKIFRLAKKFKYKMNPTTEGDINKLFEYLGLSGDIDDFKGEIAMENERAIEKAADKAIEALPFGIESYNSNDFNCKVTIEYATLIDYLKENNSECKTIKEFLENVSELDDISTDIEYEGKYEYMGDFKDLDNSVNSTVDNYLDSPDEVFPKLIQVDNLDAFKENVKMAIFSWRYKIQNGFNQDDYNLFEMAKKYDGDICKWFKTSEFEKIIMDGKDEDDERNYKDFVLGGDMEKYNL